MGQARRGLLFTLSVMQLKYVVCVFLLYDFCMTFVWYFALLGQRPDTTFVTNPYDTRGDKSEAQFGMYPTHWTDRMIGGFMSLHVLLAMIISKRAKPVKWHVYWFYIIGWTNYGNK